MKPCQLIQESYGLTISRREELNINQVIKIQITSNYVGHGINVKISVTHNLYVLLVFHQLKLYFLSVHPQKSLYGVGRELISQTAACQPNPIQTGLFGIPRTGVGLRSLPSQPCMIRPPPLQGFFLSFMDKLGKIRQLHWKERLE